MRSTLALPVAALLVFSPTPSAGAQVLVTAMVGATGSSALVNDQVVQTIEAKPGLAPTLLLTASLPVGAKLRASLDLGYSSSTVDLTEDGSVTEDFGSLGTFTASAALVGKVVSRLDWRLSLGILQYMPSEDTGIFAGGVPMAALFGAGLDWRQPLSGRWSGVAGLRYDLHLFTTPALEAAGFSGSQQVSRVGFALGAAWDFQ